MTNPALSLKEREGFICLSTLNMTTMWNRNNQHPDYHVSLIPHRVDKELSPKSEEQISKKQAVG